MNLHNILKVRVRALLLLLGLISLSSGLVYRFYALNWPGVVLAMGGIVLVYTILWYFGPKFNLGFKDIFFGPDDPAIPEPAGNRPLLLLYLCLWLSSILLLAVSGTAGSIISPWQSVSLSVLAAYFLASLVLLLFFSKLRAYSPWLPMLHYALSFSVIIFVYRLGYGYDFFVHQATLELIDKAGFVLPKSNYYSGQYGIIMMLHRLFALPIYWSHLLLVPLLAALLLPALLLDWFKKADFRPDHQVLALLLLALPYGILTFTTPQNLAYLFLVMVVALSWQPSRADLLVATVLALAAILIQPIAGLPAALLVAWRISETSKTRFATLARGILLFVSIAGLPLAFARLEVLNFSKLSFVWPDWIPASWPAFPSQELAGWNFLYFFGNNWFWIVSALTVAGLMWRKENAAFNQTQKATTILACAFLLAHWLTKALPFSFLIGYERDDYAGRLLMVAIILSLPLIATAWARLLSDLEHAKRAVRYSWLVFLAFSLTASFYLSYPRFDRYANSRGYSVGEHDIEAARWIEQDSKKPYVVLANQQVSAAALKEFGFAHYYNDLFYYPVPTASPLYQAYLKMVYEKPSKDAAQEAARLAGVDSVYFVLNKYWYAFPKVMNEAKFSADSWQSFGSNDVMVFKYEF